MERIIEYDELPSSEGQSIYFRFETDPKLYMNLFTKGYRIVRNIKDVDASTIYVTGKRQAFDCCCYQEYKRKLEQEIEKEYANRKITKPTTENFSYVRLINYGYQIPFVLKNENQNGGREKFLIYTESDYINLINTCNFLINGKLDSICISQSDRRFLIDYQKYLESNFVVQEYIQTPSKYNTTVRVLTSPSNDVLYAALKYNQQTEYIDETTLLGYLLSSCYPLSTKSIVSNTLSGGKNILLGEKYTGFDQKLIDMHNINQDQFYELLTTSCDIHKKYSEELGIICGFDYIYSVDKDKWYLLEYHSRPMLKDYSTRQNISYITPDDKSTAEGRIRATALSLTLKKKSH